MEPQHLLDNLLALWQPGLLHVLPQLDQRLDQVLLTLLCVLAYLDIRQAVNLRVSLSRFMDPPDGHQALILGGLLLLSAIDKRLDVLVSLLLVFSAILLQLLVLQLSLQQLDLQGLEPGFVDPLLDNSDVLGEP